ncbi:spore germination protein [Sporosarcina highlanderae]|uniref:Spore germination protein n=1 Tax=Sporosarcina highlanderae TaxID=3035916 RepID=A0ABT8JR47_9BACL|nr:spore germination protein [Sporosarcina highlanderae]MDN4607638.1 spore germination protein [Sporosarcina highlanderae]
MGSDNKPVISKKSLKQLFYNSMDFVIIDVEWPMGKGILCYYSSLADPTEANKQIDIIRQRALEKTNNWGKTAASDVKPYSEEELVKSVCSGQTVIIFEESQLMLTVSAPNTSGRTPSEPETEQVVRGPHDGFVESTQINLTLIRQKLHRKDLVVKSMEIGADTSTTMTYLYIDTIADKDVVKLFETKLEDVRDINILNTGEIEDYLEGSVYSPFPQLLYTERPDRVVFNLMEGKIALFADNSPSAMIAPVTFFSFFQSPDDFNGRVIIGSFFRLLRIISLVMAIFLPAFYIAVVSFHSEILPIELSKKVKLAINEIPYRPIFEAFILEVFIELIREASIRLPKPIGQTIGVVGGLIIGDAIVSAGLVSNLMVIVVALTAISSFVVPTAEMNMSIRILRFPFMIAAALFGFFGMAIGMMILTIHLLTLSSLKQPYFAPFIPLDTTRFMDIFLRSPYTKFHKQQKTFTFISKKKGRKS